MLLGKVTHCLRERIVFIILRRRSGLVRRSLVIAFHIERWWRWCEIWCRTIEKLFYLSGRGWRIRYWVG
jgi:hypothetical protein